MGRELRRHNLALRMLRHEVRTQTIRQWTGLSDARIHRLWQSVQETWRPIVARHRGPAPTHVARFVRSERVRSEAATIAGICYVLNVLPPQPMPNAQRVFPGLVRGERLCEAYERFQALVPRSDLTLEHVIGLMRALAEGSELGLMHCVDCGAAVLVDKLGFMRRRCAQCARNAGEADCDGSGEGEGGGTAEGEDGGSTSGIQGRLFR